MSDDIMTDGRVPLACTLPTAEQPLRLREFDGLFRSALRTVARPERTRLVLTLEPAPGRAAAVRDLTRRETECCSFFTFVLDEERSGGLLLEVTVRRAHTGVLDGIAVWAGRASGAAT